MTYVYDMEMLLQATAALSSVFFAASHMLAAAPCVIQQAVDGLCDYIHTLFILETDVIHTCGSGYDVGVHAVTPRPFGQCSAVVPGVIR